MKSKLKDYAYLRKEYPEIITKEQFYKIAHISKATALYLLTSGKVPCVDSGKKTRKYKIRLDDVIAYLVDRDLHPEKYYASDAWYKDRSGYHKSAVTYRAELEKLTPAEIIGFRNYIQKNIEDYADLLSIADVEEITGYCDTSLHRWCLDQRVKHFRVSGKILIPKECFLDLITSTYCCNIIRKSRKHLLIIESFLKICHKDKT